MISISLFFFLSTKLSFFGSGWYVKPYLSNVHIFSGEQIHFLHGGDSPSSILGGSSHFCKSWATVSMANLCVTVSPFRYRIIQPPILLTLKSHCQRSLGANVIHCFISVTEPSSDKKSLELRPSSSLSSLSLSLSLACSLSPSPISSSLSPIYSFCQYIQYKFILKKQILTRN